MIDIAELLTVERISCNADIASKKRAFERLAEILAAGGAAYDEREIFDALNGRERLGSTGLGHGVALPHGRMEALQQPLAAVLTLASGVDFDAPDDQPVSLLFGLLMPQDCNEQHLQILATLAGMFSDTALRERLQQCVDADALLGAIAEWQAATAPPHTA